MDETVSTETVLKWRADNVAEWLKAVGLEKYLTKFKRNMITGAILVQLDELLLDDLNITNINDRDILLQSVAAFNVEDCTKPGLLDESSLITSFADDGKHENTKCQPEMEVMKKNENAEKKTTESPAFAELLPTIGEEDEIDDRGEKVSNQPLTMISSSSNDVIQTQLGKLKKTDIDMVDTVNENGQTERNASLSKDVASSSSGHGSSGLEDKEVASRATQIVQVFSEENMCLRKQLEKYYQQVKHLKSVDKELRDTQIMYKDLKSAFITREHKEKAMRSRMEAEIAQLQTSNAELTDQLKELQTVLVNRPEKELKELKDEINQKDDEVKQLQKERKISKSSLQNLERILKQKSTEIIMLRQQLEKSVCIVCRSKQLRENQNNESSERKTSGDYLEQFHQSMMKSSSGRYATKFQSRSYKKFKNEQNDLEITTCVPVLVELLKEKDAEIVKLRNEIDREISRVPEIADNKWSSSIVGERLPKYRYSKQRYSDLETEIKSLHVKLAEKDAQIRILQCKYGESSQDSSNALPTPFRVPSFTSQSSVSSYQDSGIMTASDGHFDDATLQNTKDEKNPESYSLRLQESDYYDDEINGYELNQQVSGIKRKIFH